MHTPGTLALNAQHFDANALFDVESNSSESLRSHGPVLACAAQMAKTRRLFARPTRLEE